MQNFDFDESVLSNAITDPTTSATTLIIDNFDDLRAKSSNPHNRAQLIYSQINPKSVRRAIGLLRDEIYWKFGRTNINPQLHFVPGGLDRKKIKMVSRINSEFGRIRVKRMTINLWEFDTQS